jgi:hypothetical protein
VTHHGRGVIAMTQATDKRISVICRGVDVEIGSFFLFTEFAGLKIAMLASNVETR